MPRVKLALNAKVQMALSADLRFFYYEIIYFAAHKILRRKTTGKISPAFRDG